MAEETSKDGSSLESKLAYKVDFAWSRFSDEQRKLARIFVHDYMIFLREARTERERVAFAERVAQGKGFKKLELGIEVTPGSLQPGAKVYYINKKKNIGLFIVGDSCTPMNREIRLVGAHADFPRIDLKVRPLYEDDKCGVALLKTHYYGGLKKYQFATIPLALTGVVVKRDGSVVNVEVGLDQEDPVFTIPDLLIHLGRTIQGDRKAFEVLKGEEMNALAGALQVKDEKVKERFKINVLAIINEKYGITESDFHSADLTLVPAINPRYIGFDKSMVGGPGQDDGSCSYLSLRAILDLNGSVPRTVGTILFDKEETGSEGATGAQSIWIQQVINDLMVRVGIPETRVNLDACLSNTKMLSADVTAAMDPSFGSVHDPKNAPIFGKGLVVEKYTGHGGKSGTSEATAEFMATVLSILEKAKVPHQVGSLGAVDIGGGGTIAKYFASAFNCDVVDAGVALLNMHSPFEVSHVADLYSGYLGYKAFFTEP